jgi:hypothetical protein
MLVPTSLETSEDRIMVLFKMVGIVKWTWVAFSLIDDDVDGFHCAFETRDDD